MDIRFAGREALSSLEERTQRSLTPHRQLSGKRPAWGAPYYYYYYYYYNTVGLGGLFLAVWRLTQLAFVLPLFYRNFFKNRN